MISEEALSAKRSVALRNGAYSRIRGAVVDELLRYAFQGVVVDAFLYYALCNDLSETVSRAQGEDNRALREIMTFIRMELPKKCWGSVHNVETWIREFSKDAEAESYLRPPILQQTPPVDAPGSPLA